LLSKQWLLSDVAPKSGVQPVGCGKAVMIATKGQEAVFSGKVRLLDASQTTSVTDAVDQLNRGSICCPEGCCVVCSESLNAYYLLFQSHRHRLIIEREFKAQVGGKSEGMERRTDCHDQTWSNEYSRLLAKVGQMNVLDGQVRQLDTSKVTSITDAVFQLRQGTIMCPEGFCVVYSERFKAYYLLYRSDKKDEAFAVLQLEGESPSNPSVNKVCAEAENVMAEKSMAEEAAAFEAMKKRSAAEKAAADKAVAMWKAEAAAKKANRAFASLRKVEAEIRKAPARHGMIQGRVASVQ
jgi:hypothetical protein